MLRRRKSSSAMPTVVSMRWTVGVLLILVVIGVAITSWPDREPDSFIFSSEVPNIGVGARPLLPVDQPLTATLFLTSGTGAGGDPHIFCLVAGLGDGRRSCLFEVSLVGASGDIDPGGWYQLTASFTGAPNGHGDAGELLAVSPPASVRIAGPALERQSRFFEQSEKLSNWAVAHDVSGYLRTEGSYVWYLSDEAREAAGKAGIAPLWAVWVDAR